jgi:hypothetical protein
MINMKWGYRAALGVVWALSMAGVVSAFGNAKAKFEKLVGGSRQKPDNFR